MSVNILLKRSSTANKRPDGSLMVFGELNLNYDAATGGIFYKDSAGGVVKVGPCQVSATAPNSVPAGSAGNSLGEFWYDTGTNTLKVFDGTVWQETGGAVQGITGTAPITVDNTDPLNPVVGINAATTAASGAVQLNDTVNSTSTSQAATANAVKTTYDLAAAALPKSGGTMTGNIGMGAAAGIDFFDTSRVTAISDSTSLTSSVTAASSTAVKAAYDLASGAMPASGGTFSGPLTFSFGQVFPGVVTSVTAAGGSAISVDNTVATQPILSIASATTTTPGVVQLNDTTSSTSTTEALTAAQGKSLQDQIDALVITNNLTLAGTFDASTGLVDSVTTAGAGAGFSVGSALPAPAAGNADYFVIVDVQGSTGPSGTPPYHIGDWFLSDGSAWQFLNVGFQAAYATTTSEGVVQLATDAEVQAGSNTDHAVVPSSLQSKMSDSTSTTSSTTIASSTAVKAAYDLADAALPKAGGTMTGDITFSDAGEGVIFSDSSKVSAISDSTSTTSSVTAASSTAVKSAYDLANAAVPDSSFLNAGDLLVGTGAGTYGNLPAGAANYILSSDGAGNLVWVANAPDGITSITGTSPITIDNTTPSSPVVEINSATTSAPGAVQLNDTVTSTSTTQAATANAVKTAYDLAAAAMPKAGGTFTGNVTFDTGTVATFNELPIVPTTTASVPAANQIGVVINSATGELTPVSVYDAGTY